MYTLSLILIFIFSLTQLNLLLNFLKASKKKDILPDFKRGDLPKVTIQLPIFNELYVVERLLDTIILMDYPNDKLEIQVLDDSTDETVEITAKKVAELKAKGFDIKQITRKIRTDYKAGALREALDDASGEFIAIFDADFLPETDFLLKTIPFFQDKEIGVVQTRWGHINRNFSALTRIQAFALDNHFLLEQVGRNSKGHYINFNGTAGIWRKETIYDAGNWHGDTLTEDLDLSFRSQLKGWKFKYLKDVVSPAELPMHISAAKSQQFRWNKGGAENFMKMGWKVMISKTIALTTKLHAIVHLLSSSMFIFVFMLGVLSVPMLILKNTTNVYDSYFLLTNIFLLSTLFLFFSYWIVYSYKKKKTLSLFFQYTIDFITFFSIAMGFSFHNTLAVLEGYSGKKSAFIRTPKFAVQKKSDDISENKYIARHLTLTTVIELAFSIYFLYGVYNGIKYSDYGFVPFHIMLFFGFSFVVYHSLKSVNIQGMTDEMKKEYELPDISRTSEVQDIRSPEFKNLGV